MRVIARYVARSISLRLAVLLLGGGLFLLGFDLLENASNVMASTGEGLPALLRYGVLRLPAILSLLLPIAALIAGLLSFAEHMRHRELVAVWNAGASPFRLLRALLPVCALLAAVQFLVDDRLVPQTAQALRAWGVDADLGASFKTTDFDVVWLRSGPDILRIPSPDPGRRRLRDITIFRRDEQGILRERIDAAVAERQESGWRLKDVVRRDAGGRPVRRLPEMTWTDEIEVEAVELLSTQPQALALRDLLRVIQNNGYGQRSPSLYRTWLHARLAGAFLPGLMLLLAASLAQRYRRTGGVTRLFLFGLSIGFATLIFLRTAIAMGEVGVLPPWLAGWVAAAVMLSLIARFALHQEPSAL